MSFASMPSNPFDSFDSPLRVTIRSVTGGPIPARRNARWPARPFPTLATMSAQEMECLLSTQEVSRQVYVRSPHSGLWHEARLLALELYNHQSAAHVKMPNGQQVPLWRYLDVPPVTVVQARVALVDFPDADFTVAGYDVTWHVTDPSVLATTARLATSFEEMIEAQELGVWRP